MDADADTEGIDLDGDGVSAEEDFDDKDPTSLSIHEDPECDGFYLHSNGVTVRCPDVAVYDTGLVDAGTHVKTDVFWTCGRCSTMPCHSAKILVAGIRAVSDARDVCCGHCLQPRPEPLACESDSF